MKQKDIIETIEKKFPDEVVASDAEAINAFIAVKPEALHKIVEFMHDDENLLFDMCHSIAGVDYAKDKPLAITYHFTSYKFKHWLTVKVEFADRENCEIETISDIYGGANWHEREAYDLLGIIFKGHPNLKRILTPDDWEGHPLRKDYQMPETYQGVKAKAENTWASNAFHFPEKK